MPIQSLLGQASDTEPWVNSRTAEVDSWLRAPGVEAITERLVCAWCEGAGLAVQLADELEDLVRTKLEADWPHFWVNWRLRRVSWNQLAEQYALIFCGLTEDDLVDRQKIFS